MSILVKGLGFAGSVFTTGMSGYNVYDDYSEGRSVDGWDVLDLVIGTVGLAATVVVAFTTVAATSPIIIAIGLTVTVYGLGRLGYDLITTDW